MSGSGAPYWGATYQGGFPDQHGPDGAGQSGYYDDSTSTTYDMTPPPTSDGKTGDTIATVRQKILSEKPAVVSELADEWLNAYRMLDAIGNEVVAQGKQLDDDWQSPNHTDQKFLAMGPGKTMVYLDYWKTQAANQVTALRNLVNVIEDAQSQMNTLYQQYLSALQKSGNQSWSVFFDLNPFSDPHQKEQQDAQNTQYHYNMLAQQLAYDTAQKYSNSLAIFEKNGPVFHPPNAVLNMPGQHVSVPSLPSGGPGAPGTGAPSVAPPPSAAAPPHIAAPPGATAPPPPAPPAIAPPPALTNAANRPAAVPTGAPNVANPPGVPNIAPPPGVAGNPALSPAALAGAAPVIAAPPGVLGATPPGAAGAAPNLAGPPGATDASTAGPNAAGLNGGMQSPNAAGLSGGRMTAGMLGASIRPPGQLGKKNAKGEEEDPESLLGGKTLGARPPGLSPEALASGAGRTLGAQPRQDRSGGTSAQPGSLSNTLGNGQPTISPSVLDGKRPTRATPGGLAERTPFGTVGSGRAGATPPVLNNGAGQQAGAPPAGQRRQEKRPAARNAPAWVGLEAAEAESINPVLAAPTAAPSDPTAARLSEVPDVLRGADKSLTPSQPARPSTLEGSAPERARRVARRTDGARRDDATPVVTDEQAFGVDGPGGGVLDAHQEPTGWRPEARPTLG